MTKEEIRSAVESLSVNPSPITLQSLYGRQCVGYLPEELKKESVSGLAELGVNPHDRLFVTSVGAPGEVGVTCATLVTAGDFLLIDGFMVEVEIEDVGQNVLYLSHEVPDGIRVGSEVFPVVTARWNPRGEINPQQAASADGRWATVMAGSAAMERCVKIAESVISDMSHVADQDAEYEIGIRNETARGIAESIRKGLE